MVKKGLVVASLVFAIVGTVFAFIGEPRALEILGIGVIINITSQLL